MNEPEALTLAKIAAEDQDWVSPEVATEVLRRQASHEEPVSHEKVLEDLAQQ